MAKAERPKPTMFLKPVALAADTKAVAKDLDNVPVGEVVAKGHGMPKPGHGRPKGSTGIPQVQFISPDVRAEEYVRTEVASRDWNKHRTHSIIKQMPNTAQVVQDKGIEHLDLQMSAKVLAVKHVILLEKMYDAKEGGEDGIPLLKKLDIANKAIGLIDKLRDGWRDVIDKPKYPATEREIDLELAARTRRIADLDKAIETANPRLAAKLIEEAAPQPKEDEA